MKKEFTFILYVSGENIQAHHLFGTRADEISIFLIAEPVSLKRTCKDLTNYLHKKYALTLPFFHNTHTHRKDDRHRTYR
jgi:hypothetical protein